MASQNNNENSNSDRTYTRDRRGSFSVGSSLSDFLTSSRTPQAPTAYPGPITSAAAHANNQRRMSLSSASGSPPKVPSNFSLRRGSVSSISSISTQDESAIDDSEPAQGSPSSPFARRMSWGAKALRDVRLPGRGVPPSPGASSPTISRGFWLDNGKSSNGVPTDPALQQRRMSMPQPPVSSMPAPKETHDPLQERMLRNEFYMD